MQRLNSLYIAESENRGRGVFTISDIPKGAIIEICPVIVLDALDKVHIHQTYLHDYYFDWGDNELECAIALGYGSIYNHSKAPNADYFMITEDKTIIIECIEDIKAGDEITFLYTHKIEDEKALWFKVK